MSKHTKVLCYILPHGAYFSDENILYQTKQFTLAVPAESVTLGVLKDSTGLHHFRYFFQESTTEGPSLEIQDDASRVPHVSGDIICWLKPLDGDKSSEEKSNVQVEKEEKKKPSRWALGKTLGCMLGVGVLAGVGAVAAAPVVLAAVGFTATGITGGSIAAGMMSSAAIANGGGVAAGSLVAVLQSVGAAGLGATGMAAVGGTAGAAAAGVTAGAMAAFGGKDEDENADGKEAKDEKKSDDGDEKEKPGKSGDDSDAKSC